MIYYRVALECDKCAAQFGKMRTAMNASDAPFVAGQLLDQALAAGWTSNGHHLCRKCARRARVKANPDPALFASVRALAVTRSYRRTFDAKPDPRCAYSVQVLDVVRTSTGATGADYRVIGTTKDERQAYEWELAEHAKAGCATRIIDLLTGQVIFHRKAERRAPLFACAAHGAA
jgi:hypothetical protein